MIYLIVFFYILGGRFLSLQGTNGGYYFYLSSALYFTVMWLLLRIKNV